MAEQQLNDKTLTKITTAQKNEITEYRIYTRLAERTRDSDNAEILLQIAGEELEHYRFWKRHSGREVKPALWKVYFYHFISIIFGLTFSIKLLENGEKDAQLVYGELAEVIPEAARIVQDEDRHEQELIAMIEEERLQYVGSMVLGLNDALVELTGTLAGLTFALRDTAVIALAGSITGIAAAFSMAASEYLSTKSEEDTQKMALTSSLYTGGAYIITVLFLILPYLILSSYVYSLLCTIGVAIIIIFVFNFYIAVARDLDFKKRFLEMATISLGVALFTFVIGLLIRVFLGVDI